jgi:substrate import-associated zinc metallohydrolase lipoprotein
MHKRKYLILVMLLAAAVGCDDAYNDTVDPGRTDYVNNDNKNKTELDNWLLAEFTQPYNIEVKYRWDASEGDIYRTLVPPKTGQIQPVMDVVKKVWIQPYADVAGGMFIKNYCPKQFLLIGSARYNLDGTFTLGTAEGGRKVVLYVINEFQQTDRNGLKAMMHTVHHEFAHILNQKVAYPAAFRELAAGQYTNDWRFISLNQARASGFITNYAMSSPDEDFVEMVAVMLMEGKEGYEALLQCQANDGSKRILEQKEQIVVQYFRDAFGINFYQLQEKVQLAMNQIAPPDDDPTELPPLFDVWGHDKENKAVTFDLFVMNEPQEFVGRFNQDNLVMHEAGLALDYNFKLYFATETELALRLYYYEVSDEARVFKQANFYYFFERKDDGTVGLVLAYGDENALYLANELKASALAGYFNDRVFRIEWLEGCTKDVFVAFYPVNSPENYCFGVLSN